MTQSSDSGTKSPWQARSAWFWLVIGGAVLLLAGAIIFQFQPKTKTYQPDVQGGPSLKIIRILGDPQIKMEGQKVNFGDIKTGTSAKVTFTIENVGDQVLSFLEAPYTELAAGC